MPPIPAGAIVAGAAQVGGDIINAIAGGAMNRRQRRFIREMYNVQRHDNLVDMHYQNLYNSPVKQMERLKKAGLNPNLVYDNGAAMVQAAPVKGADFKNYSPVQPQFQLGQAVSEMYDIQAKEESVNVMKKQQELMDENITKAVAETIRIMADTDWKNTNTSFLKDTSKLRTDIFKGQLSNLQAMTVLNQDENTRRNKLNSMTIKEVVQRIAQMKLQGAKTEAERNKILQETRNLFKEGILKQQDINWNSTGNTRNDPWYIKMPVKMGKRFYNWITQ